MNETTENFRYTYHYQPNELIEYLREMRQGIFVSHSGYLMRREVYLQAEELGLIRLPEGCIRGECHLIPFQQLTILNEAINRNE